MRRSRRRDLTAEDRVQVMAGGKEGEWDMKADGKDLTKKDRGSQEVGKRFRF